MADRAQLVLSIGLCYYSGSKTKELDLRVLIDGKPLGWVKYDTPDVKNNPEQPFRVELDPGPHRMTARSEGEDITFEADFEMGRSTRWARLFYNLYPKYYRPSARSGLRKSFSFEIQDKEFGGLDRDPNEES